MEKQLYTNIIYGKESIDAFDKFVEDWKAQGGDQITQDGCLVGGIPIVLPQGRISLDHGIGMDTGHVSHRADGPGTTDEDACLALRELSHGDGFEIVLVDTGSKDRTVELARRYTDRIFSFDWCDDFSAAKNYALSKASHDWILSLDCDEYIETIDTKALLKCMERHLDTHGYRRHGGLLLSIYS